MADPTQLQDTETFCKLFIANLSYTTTEDILKSYFETWGEVINAVIVRDPQTKKSKGFGFVTYQCSASVDQSQQNRPHTIDNREVQVKRALPKDAGKDSVNKCFVGGVKEGLSEDDLRDYFSKFGIVENVHVVTDRETKRNKGFAFVTFDDHDVVDKLVLIKHHDIRGLTCEVKKAVSKDAEGGGRGRGAPGGGYNNGGGYSRGGNGDSYGGGGGGGGGSSGYYDSYSGGPMKRDTSSRGAGPYGGGYGGGARGGGGQGRGYHGGGYGGY